MTLLIPGRRPLQAPPFTSSELLRRAGAAPRLDQRFAEDKSLVDRSSGRQLITFSRTSSGTYFDSQGVLQTAASGVPRFDHNPVTGESLGLLVEEQRTNLLLRSEELDNAGWVKGNTSVSANIITAPSGALSADKVIADATSNSHYVRQIPAYNPSTTYTVSVYAKPAEQAILRISCFIPTVGIIISYIDLFSGSITNSNNTWNIERTIVSASVDNWFRIAITFTTGGTGGDGYLDIGGTTASGVSVYTGNGASGIYLWGAQLEAGAFPTSYIPTTTAAATRSADVASITGANFSSWFNASVGTIFCATSAIKDTSGVVYGFGDTFDNTLYVTPGSTNTVIVRSGGAFSAFMSVPISTSDVSRSAVAYKLDDFAAVSDGGLLSTFASGDVPINPVRFKIGSSAWDPGAFNIANGHIRRITYWPARLSSATLQAITR